MHSFMIFILLALLVVWAIKLYREQPTTLQPLQRVNKALWTSDGIIALPMLVVTIVIFILSVTKH